MMTFLTASIFRNLILKSSIVIILASLFIVALNTGNSSSNMTMPELKFVAHAGGAFNGAAYQNSMDALNLNYARGYRYFELDFSWTSDQALVGIHDWDASYSRLFEQSSRIPDLAGFSSQVMKDGSLPVTLKRLRVWLNQNPDAMLISDIKEDNLKGLIWINDNFPEVAQKLIPQIYAPDEYEEVQKIGYPNIILSVYKLLGTAEKSILDLAQNKKLFAVTMPEHWLAPFKLSGNLVELGVPVCVHTINRLERFESLQSRGVSCIYTDKLLTEKDVVSLKPDTSM